MPSAMNVIRPPSLYDLQAAVLQLAWFSAAATPVVSWTAAGFAREFSGCARWFDADNGFSATSDRYRRTSRE